MMAKKSKQQVWDKKKQKISAGKYLKERHEIKSINKSTKEISDPCKLFARRLKEAIKKAI